MSERHLWGTLPPSKSAPLPPLVSLTGALGPGVIFMALAQGSGELIWWPYIIAKYGLTFLFLLLPACLLQFPIIYEIGRYTLFTDESIFQGFIRLNRFFALGLWILMTLSFLWLALRRDRRNLFGRFEQLSGRLVGKSAIAVLGYCSIAFFLAAILLSRVIYRFLEIMMWGVALVTFVGLLWACANQEVLRSLPAFLNGLLLPPSAMPRPWEPADATKLLTAITFAGLGGFWSLFYSYWLRDKGAGMAHYMGRLTGPITGKPESIPASGSAPNNDEGLAHVRCWKRYLFCDVTIGIGGNLLTTLMTCLLAYALLFPKGFIPQGWELAAVQSRFFEASWGWAGKIIFLIAAAAFLSDTWVATIDAVSRIHTDCVYAFFPRSQPFSVRAWYLLFLFLLTGITGVTMGFAEPGPLILLSAVIGFIGTVLFSVALIFLNHVYLPRHVPALARPGRTNLFFPIISCGAYFALAMLYLLTVLGYEIL